MASQGYLPLDTSVVQGALLLGMSVRQGAFSLGTSVVQGALSLDNSVGQGTFPEHKCSAIRCPQSEHGVAKFAISRYECRVRSFLSGHECSGRYSHPEHGVTQCALPGHE